MDLIPSIPPIIPIIPAVSPLFYLFMVIAFLLFVLALIILVRLLRSGRSRRIYKLSLGITCVLAMLTVALPVSLYGNKPAPLASSTVLIDFGHESNAGHWPQIVALNASDGSVRWTQPLSFYSPTPISAAPEHLVYAIRDVNKISAVVIAYAMSNGRQIWQSLLPLLPNNQYDDLRFPQLLVSDGRVYVVESVAYYNKPGPRYTNLVYALRSTDGYLQWKYMQQTANPAEPFLSAAGNGLLLIQTPDDGGFSTFRASNGSLAWHFSPAPLQKGSTFTYQQVLANGAIYFLQDAWPCHSPLATGTCPQEQISLLALSQNDGKTLWQKHLPMPDTSQLSQFKANNSNLWGENDFALAASYLQAFRNSSLAVAGVHLYLNTYGIALAVLNVSNGVQIWQDPDSTFRATAQPTPGNDRCPGTAISSAYNAPLTEVNNRTYVARDGALHALDARTGKVLWTLNASPDGSFTTPIFYRNVLFAGALAIPGARFCPGSGQDAVVAINPSTGSVYWSTTNATSLVGIFPL